MDSCTIEDWNLRGLMDTPVKSLSEDYINRGLRFISCFPAHENKYEVISMYIADKGKQKADFCYLNLYEPKLADTGYTCTSLTNYQKNLIYEFTSTHWNDIIQTMKESYSRKENVAEFDKVIDVDSLSFPSQSPDYRLI